MFNVYRYDDTQFDLIQIKPSNGIVYKMESSVVPKKSGSFQK